MHFIVHFHQILDSKCTFIHLKDLKMSTFSIEKFLDKTLSSTPSAKKGQIPDISTKGCPYLHSQEVNLTGLPWETRRALSGQNSI